MFECLMISLLCGCLLYSLTMGLNGGMDEAGLKRAVSVRRVAWLLFLGQSFLVVYESVALCWSIMSFSGFVYYLSCCPLTYA